MAVIVGMKCSQRDNIVTQHTYGYEQANIGIPFVRCEKCGAIGRVNTVKKLGQMSNIDKFTGY